MDSDVPSVKVDTTVPASAWIWNYRPGSNDCYPAGQEAGDQFAHEIVQRMAPDPRIAYVDNDPPENLTNLGGVARQP